MKRREGTARGIGMINYVRSTRNERITEKGQFISRPGFFTAVKSANIIQTDQILREKGGFLFALFVRRDVINKEVSGFFFLFYMETLATRIHHPYSGLM